MSREPVERVAATFLDQLLVEAGLRGADDVPNTMGLDGAWFDEQNTPNNQVGWSFDTDAAW
jgi:hypothetical protein